MEQLDDLTQTQKDRDKERAREFCECLGNGKPEHQCGNEELGD